MEEIELNEMSDKDVEKMLKNFDFFSRKYFQNRKFCMAYDKTTCSGDIIQSYN